MSTTDRVTETAAGPTLLEHLPSFRRHLTAEKMAPRTVLPYRSGLLTDLHYGGQRLTGGGDLRHSSPG
jgi:hypothetical protein